MYESDDKMVSHPSHYQSETGLEVIDVIEAFTFDLKVSKRPILVTLSSMRAAGKIKTAFRI